MTDLDKQKRTIVLNRVVSALEKHSECKYVRKQARSLQLQTFRFQCPP